MASVRKRTYEDGKSRWVVDFKDGDGKRVIKTFEKKKAADAFRDSIVQKVEAGLYLPKSKVVSWTEASRLWLEDCERRAKLRDKMTNASVVMYRGSALRMDPFLSSLKLSEITVERLQRAVDELSKTKAGATVCHSIRVAGSVFDFAITLGHAVSNPVRSKRLRLPQKRRCREIPPKEALRAVLNAVRGDRAKHEQVHATYMREVIIVLAIFGGLRRGEICGLRWQDIDFTRRVLHVRHSLSRLDGLKDPKTKAGVRSIPIADPMMEALERLLAARGDFCVKPENFVITTRKGQAIGPTSIYSDHWRPVLIKAGLITADQRSPYRFHSLRHAAVSLLIDQGLSPMHIKGMIGHASVSTTVDVYGHLFPTDESVVRASAKVATDLLATGKRLEGVSPSKH